MPSDAGKASAGALLLVLLLAALLRVASALTLGDVERLHGDEGYYVRAARSLVAGDGYPGALRPPGYPAFVAAALALGGGSLRAARMVQIGVALLGVALVGAIVRRRFGAGAAALSALLAALDPTLIFYSHLFWSETLVATLLLGALFCLDRFDLERRDVWLAAAGVVLGAAVLTRDMLLFFVPAVVGWTWLVPGGARPSIALRRAALVVVPVLLLVVPWMLRNQALLGRPLLLSTNSWYPLAVGNLIPRDRLLGMGDENRAFVPAYYAVPGEIERAAFAREAALRAIADRQPGWIFRKLARNTYYLFSTASQLQRFVKEDWLASGWRAAGRRLARAEIAFYVLQMVLGLVALWLVPGGRVKLLVVALLLFHWAVYVVANATNRFRVPLLPLFALYVGPLLLGHASRARAAAWRVAGAVTSVAVLALIVATPLVRRLLVLLAILGLPAVLCGCRSSDPATGGTRADAAATAGGGARPNVVLISIDTLRADHLGTYGYARPTSPNLDALAGRGVAFEQATSPSSWTLPAHASLLSGVSPYRHGAISEATRIRDDVPLLAELLRAGGYHTAAFVNAPFVSRDYGFARGFASFDQRFEERRRDVAARHETIRGAVDGLAPPFFLFLHFMDVHTPYRPPKEFNVFARDRRSSQVLKDLGEGGVLALQRAAREGRLEMSPEERDRLVDLYDGEILALDAYLGTLIGAIEARFPDTVVIVTADHGEEFLEHGGFGHGDTLYQEVLHVPLLVTGPGVAHGARVPTVVALVDVVPTILDLTGVAAPPGLDGRSLLPELTGRARVDAAAGTDADRAVALHTASHDGTLSLRGVRVAQRKLLHDDRRGTSALYDLAVDPHEHRAGVPGATDAALVSALARLGVVVQAGAAPAPDAKTVESLKALGYL
ncbi:sulfatase-like hydrolase/transferase [Candidatus Binatia bacterium]|nr:sulfatase-like hydrolase/transferase [Candidatus Binatia bacterium]